MLDKIPAETDLTALLGKELFSVWQKLVNRIDETYDMDCLWNSGGKRWVYEYKYRRGGKTLCALYAKKNVLGFMIIFGKKEREQFETEKANYSEEIQRVYEESQTYHDGKWVMFEPTDTALFDDFIGLLRIKRKPNRI